MPSNDVLVRPETSTSSPMASSHRSNERSYSLPKLKRGMAAITLVASLGLIVPGSFGGPAAADISNDNPQTMVIECDLNGRAADGFEYESEVIAIDHDPGGKKLGKMQDTASSLGFVPMEGYVVSEFIAIENNELWPDVDDSSPEAAWPIASNDARLAGGYPDSFVTPRGYDFSYFGDGFNVGNGKGKKKLVDCIVTDDGRLVGKEAPESGCLRNGVLQDECFENIWVADYPEAVTESQPCLAFGDPQYDKCMAFGVTYQYIDDFYIKAVVTGNNGGAKAKSASADDTGSKADRKAKAKKGGKHRGKGKRGR